MSSLFKPIMYKENIYSINYNKLKEMGIDTLIFDLDNTLALPTDQICSMKVRDFINNLSLKFKVIIISNNNFKRVSNFCKNLNCDFIYSAMKPTKKSYFHLKNKLMLNTSKIVFIGDQIVTDIFFGNRCHFFTILVDSIGSDLKITKFNRYLENKILKKIKFKKGVYYEKD